MEQEIFWDEELPGDNDDRVSLIEADIAASKKILSRHIEEDDILFH